MSLTTTSHTATHRGVAVTAKPEPVPSGSSASGPRTAGSPTPLVEVRNLDVRFTGARRVHAVRGVSFTINPGEALAIVGESGSGKSVTSRSIVGLAGDNAELTADQFSVIGQDGLRLREGQWRAIRGRRIGFVLQDALTSLDPLRTIGREITETLRAHRIVPRRQYGERVEELLREVGIPDPQVRSRQYPHQLSGGLRQRALIASALAGAPDLLIADEPTTALDVTVQAQILDLLESRRAEGTALLLVSHDLAVVSRVADRVLVMHDGVVVEQGPTEKVLTAPEHEYTKALLAAVPSASTRGTRLSASPGIRLRARAEAPLRLRQETEGQVDTGTPVLAAHNLSKSFPLPDGGTRTAVDHVSLTLKAGQKLGIVGESGSGKSTLARLLLDLTRPDEGSIEIGGVQISGPSGQDSRPPTTWARRRSARSLSPALRRQMQFISQDPLGSFDPRYTIGEIIAEPLDSRPSRPQTRERIASLLDLVDLDESFVNASPKRLSGGQRQRVAIARALALEPRALVCDEPVSALDVSIQAQVLDLFSDLAEQTGTALLFISHDLGVIHHLVDQVLVMRYGQVIESGDVDDAFTDPLHSYTQQLVASVPRLEAEPAR